MANITKQASTRFSIVKRSKGQSAVEKASYISRSILVSEYDGQTYRPKYHEDLVHSEISLPQNAPREYADRATLWNAVELSEKGQKSQLARMLKASLPNEWSYELAEEVVRDYVQRNFVDKGMCADWAIHDSENDKGQRNLHIHVLLNQTNINNLMESQTKRASEGQPPAAYGRYKNVFLSDAELLELEQDFPDKWEYYLDRLSCHIASTGKQYHSHAATIYKWAQEDAAKGKAAPKQGIPDYSCKEGESL